MNTQEEVKKMILRQPLCWNLARENYEALNGIETKSIFLDGHTIRVQFNPARTVSTNANVDKDYIRKRRCFLCPENLPAEQLRLPVLDKYIILCNPYPIFPSHLTISSVVHSPQLIHDRIDDMLRLAQLLPEFTIFYNGPCSGASAPDHAHFQASPFGLMPIDEEIPAFFSSVIEYKAASVHELSGYLRNGFVITSDTKDGAAAAFTYLYKYLPIDNVAEEPMMNLFANKIGGGFRLTVIPRKRHRPWQYFEEAGNERFLSSPGAADIGGLFITVRADDFSKVSDKLLRDIYSQVCYGDDDITEIFSHLQ